MDAVNLGRVGLFLRGEWLPDTSYVPLDVVSHDGASFWGCSNFPNCRTCLPVVPVS